jgi:hypothetical protein
MEGFALETECRERYGLGEGQKNGKSGAVGGKSNKERRKDGTQSRTLLWPAVDVEAEVQSATEDLGMLSRPRICAANQKPAGEASASAPATAEAQATPTSRASAAPFFSPVLVNLHLHNPTRLLKRPECLASH